MQMYHSHPKEVEYSQRHFMNQITVQTVRAIVSKHGIDYDKLTIGAKQVLYARVVQQQRGLDKVLSRACGTHCGQLNSETIINKIYDEIKKNKDIYFRHLKKKNKYAFDNLFEKKGRMEIERELGISNKE